MSAVEVSPSSWAMARAVALSWRLPERLRRCLWVLLDHTGSGAGAVPLWQAYECREQNRPMPAVSPMILAAARVRQSAEHRDGRPLAAARLHSSVRQPTYVKQ